MSLSRRNFLGISGGLIATSMLPSYAQSESDLFAKRGIFERLVLAMRRIKCGAEKPFSILHISDTHLAAAYPEEGPDKVKVSKRRMKTFGGRQEEALRDSLEWAKKNVDYVLHTGDLIDFQSKANFDLVKKYYGDIIFGPPGNHEFFTYMPDEKIVPTEEFKAKSWDILKKDFPADASFSSKIINGVNFISMEDIFGTVREEQVEKFHIEAKKGLPLILCMHVPFFSEDVSEYAAKFWRNQGRKYGEVVRRAMQGDFKRQMEDPTTSKFIDYLKKEKALKAILCGHTHITSENDFSPTAKQYVIGGNFMFHGQEILFS
jgi:hypothetical protein